jgi:hypothetical protein
MDPESRGNSFPTGPIALAGDYNAWDAFSAKITGRIVTDGRKEEAATKRTKAGSGSRKEVFPRHNGREVDQEFEARRHRGRQVGVAMSGRGHATMAGSARAEGEEESASHSFTKSPRCNDTFHAHVVSYADDFVILSRGRAAEALAWTKAVMTKLGLTINEAKTSLRNARQERFDFLGYSFGAHRFEANGNWYLGASPSKKSVQRLKARIGDLLVPSNIDPWPEVCDKLNRSLRGWSN